MTSHDECTSGTARFLTVASLQLLKMEALIPAPADCEERFVIKFLNAQSTEPIEIHFQLCQVYGHTRLDGDYFSCRSSAGSCLIIIHPIARTSHPVIFIYSKTSRNSCPVSVRVFRMTERRIWLSQCFQSQAVDFYDTEYKSWSHCVKNFSIPEVDMLQNTSALAVSVPINISIKLCFDSVNGHGETCFLEALSM